MYSASMLEVFVFVCVHAWGFCFLTNHPLRRLLKLTWHLPAMKHKDFADLCGLDKICFCDMPATSRLGPTYSTCKRTFVPTAFFRMRLECVVFQL